MAKKDSKETAPARPMPAQPTVGRIVHYIDREEKIEADRRDDVAAPYPALITRVLDDGAVGLVVFNPELRTLQFKDSVSYDPTGNEANQWTWPPIAVPTSAPKPAQPAGEEAKG